MRTHIDWLTFTMRMIYFDDSVDAYANAIKNGIEDMFGNELANLVFGGHWEKNERSRAPYTDAWKLRAGDITLFASPTLTHCCVEISGKGCEALIRENLLDKVLQSSYSRLTRIDVASDIECEITPDAFASKVNHDRMRTSGHVVSDTGETSYVGSQKSDRYARVYRYNKPHPRSHLLRIEHVFRRDYAKKVGQACATAGLASVAKSAGEAFGWAHEQWQPEAVDGADLSVVKAESTMGGTVFWLLKSVAPAFKRLVENGTISDPGKFLRDYFL